MVSLAPIASIYQRVAIIFSVATADYQRIQNPCFNADRGPVNVFSVRLHIEFKWISVDSMFRKKRILRILFSLTKSKWLKPA
jgi:hypothetical protein